MLTLFSMSAQTVESAKFFDNWQLGVRGGVSALAHPRANGYSDWGHSIEATTSLDITKYITPVFGVGLNSQVMWENGSADGLFQGRNWLNNVNLTANAKFNLTNAFLGYVGAPRPFEIVAVAGIGWSHGFVYPIGYEEIDGEEKAFPIYGETAHTNDIHTKYAVELNYNINDAWAITAVPQVAFNLTQSRNYFHYNYNSPTFDSRNMWYGVEVGVTYKFKNANGDHNFTLCPYKYTQAEFDRLNAELNEARSAQPQVVERVVTKEVVKTVENSDVTVYFAKASYDLTPTAKSTLDAIPANTKVALVGKASPEGTAEFNQTLSENRAKAVNDYLTARGVTVTNAKGIGATEGETSPRVVVITLK